MLADKLIAALHKGDIGFDLVASGKEPWSSRNVLPHELYSGYATEPGEINADTVKALTNHMNHMGELDLNILDLLTKQYPAGDPVFRSATPVKCQFFDFGEVMWDLQNPEYRAESQASMEGFTCGLLQLPFPICFFHWLEPNNDGVGFFQNSLKEYEYTTKNEPMGLLAFQPNTEKSWFDDDINKPIVTTMFGKTNIKNFFREPVLETFYGSSPEQGDFYCLPAISFVLGEEKGGDTEILYSTYVYDKFEGLPAETGRAYTEFQLTCTLFLTTLLGRLNAEGMAKETVNPPAKVNRKRRQREEPELVKYTTVKVAPFRTPLGRSGPREEGDFTPVRYHFRRGHVRRFQNGEKTWVRHCFVGDPCDGSVEHDYVVT